MSFFWKKMPHSVSKVPRLSQPSRRLPKESTGRKGLPSLFYSFWKFFCSLGIITFWLLGWRATWKTSEGTTYTMEIASRKKTTLYVGGLDDKVAEELLHVSQCI